MKVLFLTHRVPHPPDKGDRIRSFNVLRHLSRRHDVYLATLADEPVGEEDRRVLSTLCRMVAVVPHGRGRWARGLQALCTGRPLTVGLFNEPRLQRLLSEWAERMHFDVVLSYCSSMGQYVTAAPLDRVPAVVDLVDVDSQKWLDYATTSRGWRRWLYRREARRLKRYEAHLAAHCRGVALVTEREAALFRRVAPGARVEVVSNGVDLDYFRSDAVEGASPGADCTFVGALDYYPNVQGLRWFCEHAWPEVRRRRPQATLALVGRNPTAAVRGLGRLPGVEVVGGVPDVRPYLQGSHVVIAPLEIARGVQNKVLEAMAMSRPVVVSAPTLLGLPRKAAEAAVVATTPRQWAEQIDRFCSDAGEARELGLRGRHAVEDCCRWEDCLAPLEALLAEAPAGRRDDSAHDDPPPAPHAAAREKDEDPVTTHALNRT